MNQNFYKSFALSVLLTCSLSSISEASSHYELRAFYGDKQLGDVVVIDVKRMHYARVKTEGKTPYPVDRAGYLDKVYAITRDSPTVDVIDAETLQNLGVIDLGHKPRSGEAFNSRLGLALIAGADKPITSVIDVVNDTQVAVTKEEKGKTPSIIDFGGSNASGHPAWLSKNRFVVIDRTRRLIQLWGIKKVQDAGLDYHFELTKYDTVDTPTSVHHILKRNTSMLPRNEKRVFYALAEGIPSETIPPAILKLRLTESDQLIFEEGTDQIDLPGDATIMGAHHADFHPDGQHIYVGSTEGHLFVIDSLSQEIINTISTGKGTGHTRFIAEKNIALVTNHHDTFVTVVDTTEHSFKKNIMLKVKGAAIEGLSKVEGEIQQSHTSYVSPDNKFYYAFASAYGTFFEINLDKLQVNRTLYTGGVPVQGTFINWDDFSYSANHSSSGM